MDEDTALVPGGEDESGASQRSQSLNHREFRLVEAYLAGKPPIDAAIAAGYAPTTARVKAHAILKRPHVRAEIQRRTARATGITPDYVLHSVRDLATSAKSEQVRLGAFKLLGAHHGLWEQRGGGRPTKISISIYREKKDEIIDVEGHQVEDEEPSDE